MRHTVPLVILVVAFSFAAFGIAPRVYAGADEDAGVSSVPKGAVVFFNKATCPTGWSFFTGGQGRYFVGVSAGGTLAAQVGVQLSDQENRPVGLHTHTISDPGHSHAYDKPVFTSTGSGASKAGIEPNQQTGISNTGITINSAGDVAGTNAPYIQLRACQKN